MNIFSDEMRRDPYPLYQQLRASCPVLKIPPPFDAFAVLDYEGVKKVLNDHKAFSSGVPAPKHWFIFLDPPVHSKLRALVAKAFTPRMVSNLEPRIHELSRTLLESLRERSEFDLATDYATPLPMKVIAEMIGIPGEDWERFKTWSDTILALSYTRSGGPEAAEAARAFGAVSVEMDGYLTEMIARRKEKPSEDLLTNLIQAEVDGEKLSQPEILGFFQLLVVAGQETTANLINNAILSLLENPSELARLRERAELLPSAIEETLRYRAPLQWVMRTPREDVELHGQTLQRGKLVLAMIGSANRDPSQFANAEAFDITRNPNPHVSFGHGIHSCIGAALSRIEARIALTDLLQRFPRFSRANNEPWVPRRGLHVHGPASLMLRIES